TRCLSDWSSDVCSSDLFSLSITVWSTSVVVDLSETTLVDHTVMDMLKDLRREFAEKGRHLDVRGLEGHTPLGWEKTSAHRRKKRSEERRVGTREAGGGW